ncbi:MAG: hypothetical protein ACTHMT_14730 [Verrucomicrobiota bacterium]
MITRLLLTIVLLASIAIATGCKSNPGSREFIPGKGWVPTK